MRPASSLSAPLPEAPDDVAERVDVDEALRLLATGRPQGEKGALEVDGVRFPIVTAGEGERSILLVHGLGHDMWDWTPLFERRPAGVRLRALDLPGFGLSDKPPRVYSLALLVEAVLSAARSLDKPVLVGSSLGGHIAMLASLQEPDAFSGLFLSAPGGLERAPLSTQTMARAYYSFSAICARPGSDIVKNSRRVFVRQSPACEALAVRKLTVHRSSLRCHFARPFADVVADVFRHPLGRRCAALRPPVHLFFGERDVIVPPSSGRRVAQRYGFGLTRLEGVGHLPMVEAPDAFASGLFEFTDTVWGGA